MRQTWKADNPKKKLEDTDPLPDKLRDDFTQMYGGTVEEGMKNLQKAVDLKPDYADAVAYQSLLLRQKADQSDNSARGGMESQADDLLNKVKDIKQKQAAEAESKSS